MDVVGGMPTGLDSSTWPADDKKEKPKTQVGTPQELSTNQTISAAKNASATERNSPQNSPQALRMPGTLDVDPQSKKISSVQNESFTNNPSSNLFKAELPKGVFPSLAELALKKSFQALEKLQANALQELKGISQRLTGYYSRLPGANTRLDTAKTNSAIAEARLHETVDGNSAYAAMKAAAEASQARQELKSSTNVIEQLKKNAEREKQSAKTKQAELILRAQKESEARALASLGDHEGARAILDNPSAALQRPIPMDTSIDQQMSKALAEAGLSQEELARRNSSRATMPANEQQAREYHEAVTRLSRQGQAQILGLKSQIEFLGKAALDNPNLSAEERQEFFKQQGEASVALINLERETEQLLQLQAHLTDLVDRGQFQDLLRLQNGSEGFMTTVSFNNPGQSERLLNQEPKATLEQEKLMAERLMGYAEKASEHAKRFGQRLSTSSRLSADDAEQYTGTWYGADYTTNFFDKHLGEKLKTISGVESIHGTQMERWSKILEDTRKEASKYIARGDYKSARKMLQDDLQTFNTNLQAAETKVARARTNPQEWAKVQENIDASYKAVRNGLIMTGAAIVTGGVAANFMGGGTLLTGGAVGASQTQLTGLAATKAFAMGAGTMTGTAFAAELTGSLLAGSSIKDALSYSASQIGENAKNAILGSLGSLAGVGIGGRIASRLLSPQANAGIQSIVRSSTQGAAASLPGIIDDVATRVASRQELIAELRRAGKSQAEIDRTLVEKQLDFRSMSLSAGAAFASGTASGYISGLANRAGSSLSQNLNKAEAIAAKLAIAAGEEIVQTAIAAAESSAQGYTPGTPEFEQAMIANFASLMPSRISGTVGAKIDADTRQKANKGIQLVSHQESNTTPRILDTRITAEAHPINEASSDIRLKLKDITPAEILQNIKAEDIAIANLVLKEISQFAKMDALNDLVRGISRFRQEGYTLLTDNKGSLTSGLQYLHKKGSFRDAQGNSTLPDIMRVADIEQLNPQILLRKGHDKLALMLDSSTLTRIASDEKFASKLKKLQEEGIDIKLINPHGWNNGINPFTGQNEIAQRLTNLTEQAKARIKENPGKNPNEIVTDLINGEVLAMLSAKGLAGNLITQTNQTTNHNSDFHETFEHNVRLTPPSNEDIASYMNRLNVQEQEALLEVIKRDLQILSPRSIGELSISQYHQILGLAQSKGIKAEDIYFYLPGEQEIKSSQFAALALQENMGIRPNQFFSRYKDLPQGDHKMIVILDDNSLTGDSQLKAVLNFRVQNFQGPIVSSTSIATSASERALIDRNFGEGAAAEARAEKIVRKGLAPEFRQRGLELIGQKDPNLFELPGIRYTPLLESDYYRSLPLEKQEQLKASLGHLGYGANATAIVLPWMAPNNNHSLIQGYDDGTGITRFFTFNQRGVKREY